MLKLQCWFSAAENRRLIRLKKWKSLKLSMVCAIKWKENGLAFWPDTEPNSEYQFPNFAFSLSILRLQLLGFSFCSILLLHLCFGLKIVSWRRDQVFLICKPINMSVLRICFWDSLFHKFFATSLLHKIKKNPIESSIGFVF